MFSYLAVSPMSVIHFESKDGFIPDLQIEEIGTAEDAGFYRFNKMNAFQCIILHIREHLNNQYFDLFQEGCLVSKFTELDISQPVMTLSVSSKSAEEILAKCNLAEVWSVKLTQLVPEFTVYPFMVNSSRIQTPYMSIVFKRDLHPEYLLKALEICEQASKYAPVVTGMYLQECEQWFRSYKLTFQALPDGSFNPKIKLQNGVELEFSRSKSMWEHDNDIPMRDFFTVLLNGTGICKMRALPKGDLVTKLFIMYELGPILTLDRIGVAGPQDF